MQAHILNFKNEKENRTMAIEKTESATIITGGHIALYSLMSLRSAIQLEAKGLRFSRGSMTAYAKRRFGIKGNRDKVICPPRQADRSAKAKGRHRRVSGRTRSNRRCQLMLRGQDKAHTTIIMYSEEYGAEEFNYDTQNEALDGLRRLGQNALAAFANDGVERELRILPTEYWLTIRETDEDDEDDNDEEKGDDLCDLCMSSEVSVDRTTYCGKTIGIECGCDETYEDGTCGNDECEDCRNADTTE
jgi:hypothetical protein